MASKTVESQVPPADEPAPRPPASADPAEAPHFVAELLGRTSEATDGLSVAAIASWADDRGALADGRGVRVAASCLLRPAAGDRVLIWSGDEETWVLSVLERNAADAPVVLKSDTGVTIEAPRVALQGKVVQVAASEFLSSTRNRHAVEHTRTEHSKLRVSQVGTDIRRVGTADERVSGTLMQRTGTWLSTTAREARLKARSFLFE